MATFRQSPPTPYDPWLEFDEDIDRSGAPCVNVFYCAPTEAEYLAGNAGPDAKTDRETIATVTEDLLRTYPIQVRRQSTDYLRPKYDTIGTISFQNLSYEWPFPPEQDAFVDLLERLPPGFSKQFQYGLGLTWEYRFLVESIAEIEGVREILVTGGHETRLEAPLYILGVKRYDELRRGLNSVARRNQRESHEDKRLLAYTNLNHAVDAVRFPLRTKKVRPGALYELVKVGAERHKFSREDGRAAIDVVRTEKENIARADPSALLSLKADIERVTLAELIRRFAEMLSKDLPEARWQEFLKSNPFVLSLAFAYPVFVVQDQAYVGGASLKGVGEKIADFLVAHQYTGNLALIEIKRPTTSLLSAETFRTDLFAPSRALTEAVSQVLDQRFNLLNSFSLKVYASGLENIHTYAVQSIVIAGLAPTERVQRKSLDLYRHASKDVTVVTFDELLAKLKEVHRVFADPPTPE